MVPFRRTLKLSHLILHSPVSFRRIPELAQEGTWYPYCQDLLYIAPYARTRLKLPLGASIWHCVEGKPALLPLVWPRRLRAQHGGRRHDGAMRSPGVRRPRRRRPWGQHDDWTWRKNWRCWRRALEQPHVLLMTFEAFSVARVKAAHWASGDRASDADEGRDHQHPHLHPVRLARLASRNAALRKAMAFTYTGLKRRIARSTGRQSAE